MNGIDLMASWHSKTFSDLLVVVVVVCVCVCGGGVGGVGGGGGGGGIQGPQRASDAQFLYLYHC